MRVAKREAREDGVLARTSGFERDEQVERGEHAPRLRGVRLEPGRDLLEQAPVVELAAQHVADVCTRAERRAQRREHGPRIRATCASPSRSWASSAFELGVAIVAASARRSGARAANRRERLERAARRCPRPRSSQASSAS